MNPFAISGLLIGINSIGLGILVLIKNPNRKFSLAWFMFAMFTGIWGFGIMAVGLTGNKETALLIWRVFYALGVVWIAPSFYHFVCVFLGLERKKSILIQYAIGLFFVLNIGSVTFFKNIEWVFNSFFYVRAGWLYGVYFSWWLLLVSFSHYDMICVYSSVPENKKTQIKYFFLATTVGYTGGILSYLPKFGIDIYPWGNFMVWLYHVIMGYAILKYNLMDVRIFIRRTGLLIGIYALLMIAVAPVLVSFHRHLVSGILPPPTTIWFQVAAMAGALSLGPFLYAYLIRQSYFFQEHRAAGLTHELKSPLAAIQSALEFFKEESSKQSLNPKQAEYLDLIERNSSRLNAFVGELLQVFKLQNKRKPLSDDQVDMGLLCRSVIQTYEPLAKFKGTSIDFLSIQEPIIVSCDRQKIEYVISNLLSNSVKFTLQGHITLSLIQKNQEIIVTVQDTGIGISHKDLPQVFEAFFQGGATQIAKGSGIGLTIAKTWIEAHDGHIWAESEGEGKGTKVTFTLPIK